MNYLSVENLSKSFSEKILFDGISFGIAKGEKVALIARNGTGKTTLMRILAGLESPESGQVTIRKDIRVVYLDQDPSLDPELTILESIFRDDNPVVSLIRDYEACLEQNSENPRQEAQDMLSTLMAKMEAANAWDYEVRVRQVLSRLDIHHLNQKIKSLSGGQRKRIALAKVLLEPAELILMDEPTNHLDVEMVEWLEDYLSQSGIALLLVTHDRYFLDNVCNKIIELDRGKLFSYDGNFSYFLEKKLEREVNEASEMDKARNILRTELEWIRRQPKARGTKSKSRVDSFYELREKTSGKRTEEKMKLDVKMNRIGGKVIEMKKVYKAFDKLKILQGFDYTFKTGERIGIVGKNGCGKTTFLNMLIGTEEPDSGKINVGETIVFGYYSQQGLELKEDKRVIEVVKDHAEMIQLSDGTKVQASQFLNLFQFPPEQQHTFISKLSGGERRRLHLLTVLVKNPNFLILDEPTNDLDLLTLSILEDFLMHYKGCLVIVSHDRYFMDKLVDHMFIFEGDGVIRDFNGTYSEYHRAKEEKEKVEAKQRSLESKEGREKLKEAAASATEKKKFTYKEKLEFEALEKEIELLENEKTELGKLLSDASAGHEELRKWAERMDDVIHLIDEKSMRWLELSELAG
ncbi:MAG TPA: ABC-F family ATP-binding cassette domain-containing protein [Bacteroidia bacterium]|nr:ABC-F family ATP-binding cassette domain-containing protein [Bacteroidia bacterium]HNS11541.1 ABC-F family ATP-binding cassette domain-containing protein [Bacteroidia bacterium]